MQTDTFSITPNKAKALYLAKRQLSELVCDAVNLEGILYTLPEVQTLLDGITVGGHKLSDEKLVGPGWKGVTSRKAPEWIMNFITNPDPMIDKDPKLEKLPELREELNALEADERSDFIEKA